MTGAGRGIGLAITKLLLKEGFKVFMAVREPSRVEKIILKERLNGAFLLRMDVSEQKSIEQAVKELSKKVRRIHVLVNNAGIMDKSLIKEITFNTLETVLRTNLIGPTYLSRLLVPFLRHGGYIINIGSLAGRSAFPRGGAYCASKWGLLAISEVMFQELRELGIRVTIIMPGSVDTALAGSLRPGKARDWMLRPSHVALLVKQLLDHPPESLPSKIEIRTALVPKKG